MGEVWTLSQADLFHEWTFDDLLALPENLDWRCFEILDGALVVSPSANSRHEVVGEDLRAIIRAAAHPSFKIIGSMAVDLEPSYLIPDLIVVRVENLRRNVNRLPADQVALAIEIVSPSSRSMDRFVKPQKYAEFGIPSYWRVEVDPVVALTAYELQDGVYADIGTWGPGETAVLERPFPVSIRIDDILRPE